MTRLLLIILTTLLLSSCYSYKIYPKEIRDFPYNGDKQTAFITNPELTKENGILIASNIFTFTEDSACENSVKVILHPSSKHFVCGEPILLSAITAGQVPVLFPDRYQYRFDEIHKGDTTTKNFELLIAQRTWFWDMFVLHKRFNQKAGKALFANYYSPGNPSASAKR